jgi:hypothetical protein
MDNADDHPEMALMQNSAGFDRMGQIVEGKKQVRNTKKRDQKSFFLFKGKNYLSYDEIIV